METGATAAACPRRQGRTSETGQQQQQQQRIRRQVATRCHNNVDHQASLCLDIGATAAAGDFNDLADLAAAAYPGLRLVGVTSKG